MRGGARVVVYIGYDVEYFHVDIATMFIYLFTCLGGYMSGLEVVANANGLGLGLG